MKKKKLKKELDFYKKASKAYQNKYLDALEELDEMWEDGYTAAWEVYNDLKTYAARNRVWYKLWL